MQVILHWMQFLHEMQTTTRGKRMYFLFPLVVSLRSGVGRGLSLPPRRAHNPFRVIVGYNLTA